MFSCQSLFGTMSTSVKTILKFLEVCGLVVLLILVPVFSFWSNFILCWVSESACVTMNQIGWSDAFGMEEGKLILVHHDVDNEAVSRDYIYEVKKKCASKHELMTSI